MRTLSPGRDVLLYDGSCGLCRRAARRLASSLPPESATRSFRDVGALRRFPGLDSARCERALQLVRKDGVVFEGVEAVVQSLRGRWFGWVLRGYYLPGVRRAADALYQAVARRRFHATRLPAVGEGKSSPPLSGASPGRSAAPPGPGRRRDPGA